MPSCRLLLFHLKLIATQFPERLKNRNSIPRFKKYDYNFHQNGNKRLHKVNAYLRTFNIKLGHNNFQLESFRLERYLSKTGLRYSPLVIIKI